MEKREFTIVYKKLILRFFVSMLLIATLLVIKQSIINHQIKQEENTAYIVNIAGRQRMLSQKITKDIIFIDNSDKYTNIDFYIEELQASVTLLQASHSELLALNKQVTYLGSNLKKEFTALFKAIEPSFNTIINSSSNIIEAYKNNQLSSIKSDTNAILQTENTYLNKMDTIVSAYEKEAILSIQVIKQTQIILFSLIFLVLIFVGYKIVYPLLRYLRESIEKASEYSENLTRIFRSMQGAIFIINLEKKVLVMNETAKAIDSCADENIKNLYLSQYLNWLDVSVDDVIAKFNEGLERIDDIETVVEDKGSKLINVILSAFKATYKGEEAIVISLFDITAQKQAEQILENIALKDELTGLSNRHFLNSVADKEIKTSNTYKLPLSIALIDLDNFKQVNDIYGHPVGDEILRLTADTIKENIDISHNAVRFGGEEFLILMPNTDLETAVNITENFRKDLEGKKHHISGTITASAGVVSLNGEKDFSELYTRADTALYKAKNNGRNRVNIG